MLTEIKKLFPTKAKAFIRSKLSFISTHKLLKEVKRIRENQKNIVLKVREKDVIDVVFLAIHDSVWKYEEVYRLLDEDIRFRVKVAIVPLVRNNEGEMDTYYQSVAIFNQNGYNVVESFNPNKNEWIDIKELVNPDVVFFTNPHKLTFDKYYIDNFTDKLTCYVPYAFVVIHLTQMHYGQKIHQVLWKHFVETKTHLEYAKKHSIYNVNNVLVTGYPSLDKKFNLDYSPKNVWKPYYSSAKRIIWAPHHSIMGQGSELDYSSFIEYSEYMVDLLSNREDIQIAFKPHPLLKEKLYADKSWGKSKTDAYYKLWSDLPNGQLELGPYLDLFEESDAMIMDSASFIAEYLYFDKPIAFTMRDNNVLDRFNSFGQDVFKYLYTIKTEKDIEYFISEIVFQGNDYLREKRNVFLNDVILPQNRLTASENIYNELISELC